MINFVNTKITTVCFLFFLFFLFSCGNKELKEKKENLPLNNRVNADAQLQESKDLYKQSGLLSEMVMVNLYFISRTSPKLAIEKRKVLNLPDKQQMLKQVLSTLAYGPLTKLYPSIPSNFSINETFIVGKTAYIDLRKGGDGEVGVESVDSERLFLYSIVNTALALNLNIDKVKILINGEEAETLLGHIDSSGFFKFNENIVEK